MSPHRWSDDAAPNTATDDESTRTGSTNGESTRNDTANGESAQSDSTSGYTPSDVGRRSLLATGGATASLALGGCLGVLGTDDEPANEDLDWILLWNDRFVDAVQSHREGNIAPTRQSALLNVSIFDAVNAVTAARGESHYEPYLDGLEEPSPDASRTAAGAAAAHEVLTRLFPEDVSDAYDRSIGVAEGRDGDVTAGEQWGQSVATRAFEHRSDDGEYQDEFYQACPDEPDAAGCFRRQWNPARAFVTPWTMTSRDQFRPGPPPALDSDAYAEAWQEVYELGRDREDRPQSQVDKAAFWRGAPGSARPPNMWILAASAVAREQSLSSLELARLFALLSIALADAGICAAEAKHHYGRWRPRTAIHNADADGNPDTFADPDWEPLAVGGSPEYSSGLSTVGGAGHGILVEFFGDDHSFEIGGDVNTGIHGDTEGVSRSFDSFTEAYEESSQSRIFLGNHFSYATEAGGEAGHEIASWVQENYLQPVE